MGQISAQDIDNATSTAEEIIIDEDANNLQATDVEVVASVENDDNANSTLKASTNEIYFDANAIKDGDGSENNPYKYLRSDRITSGVTAYLKDGSYELNSTCIVSGAKLIGSTYTLIFSNVVDDYDLIVADNSVLELTRMNVYNFNILNQGTLTVENVIFHGNDLFDTYFGGAIVCDNPNRVTNLAITGCVFEDIYDAYNGGCIAAINSNVTISRSKFTHYSALYRGGAIYSLNSDLSISDSNFEPLTNSSAELVQTHQNPYTAYYGGSIYSENSNITLKRTNFIGSVSFSFGGCIAALNSIVNSRDDYFNESKSLTDGGGALYISNGELYIVNSRLYNNSAEFGGAICNINSILDSYRTWYVFNSANRYGGVIYDIYGTLNLNTNLFGDSRASVGGAIYTRIPNVFNVYSNSFATGFAEKGSVIFFDGKKENMDTTFFTSQFSVNYDDLMIPIDSTGLETFNTFRNSYSVFAEFTATVNGEEYSIISNPVYYEISNQNDTYPHQFTGHTYRVSDGTVSMMIHDLNDELSRTYVYCGNELRNITAEINLTGEFINPVLKFYLIRGSNIFLYNNYGPTSSNLYTDTRDKLFKGWEYELVETYSIDLSDKVQGNTVEGSCSLDFSNPFLNFNFGNLYEAGSYYPVSLINSSFINSLSSTLNPDPLSSYYNSNDYGLVTVAKDQKNGGNCWAFAGIATLETCLKKATGVSFDFSEENAKNLMAAYSVFGVKIDTNFGGYDYMLMSYLTSWLGPIDEAIEDYDEYSSISIQENPMFHIQNIKFLPARLNSNDNDLYKLTIRDHGAVSVMLRWDGDYHAVSLVGWDDNYVGKDSLGNDANGAWIFKNSWGPDWENNGFGYLSYEEKISEQIRPDMHAYTFVFDDINPYTKIYQYDFAGVSEFYHYQDSIHFRNDFIAENASVLSAFSTYFDSQTNYTVKVYRNNEFMFSQEGTSSAGYYTIPFNTKIQLNKGDRFSIVVNNHNIGANCIPVCSADEINKKTFNSNVSFISLDGETWFDLYDYADTCHVACIKAFTQNTTLTDIKINMNEFTTIDNNNFNVKVNIEDFDQFSSLNYCLVKFIVDGNPYYAQVKNGKATLNLNLDNGVHSISAQYKDNIFESNIVQFTFTVAKNDASTSYNGLQSIINGAVANSQADFYKDYSYDTQFDDGEYGIHIDKPITINGNGHAIDGLGEATAVYISANNVELKNIIFKNTVSINGGSIYIAGRNVTLTNCTFINSRAENGGGIYSLFDINLNNCRFINNSANLGGGAYILSTLTTNIRNTLFDTNTAGTHASAIYVTGIGNITISSTNFTNNRANKYGGAIMSSVKHINFSYCIFSNNSAEFGGAIYSTDNFNEIKNSRFMNNTAEKYGGAILTSDYTNIHNSEFISNTVPYRGAETLMEQLADFGGGAIYSLKNLNIYESNFTRNNASNGGAILSREFMNIYKSEFINNTAKYGGAIYNTETRVIKYTNSIAEFGSVFTQTNIHDSIFINNSAEYGSALYRTNLVKNSTFKDNHALTTGAIYDINIVDGSRFINNSAKYAGAVYNAKVIKNSIFSYNHASSNGGAIDNAQEIVNSIFTGNSANYGGAIISSGETNITYCTFTENTAEYSGGAIYLDGKALIKHSTFNGNLATYGGAVYFGTSGRYTVERTEFNKNSASDFGGALFIYSDDEETMAYVDINLCNFTENNVAKSGGAIYTDGKTTISTSKFIDNTANWGSAIYARAYLDMRDSNVKAYNDDTPVSYAAHYNEDDSFYGEIYLKNNVFDANIGLFYSDDEVKSTSQFYLVFSNTKTVRGPIIPIAHLEDDNGNMIQVYGMGDLYLTLTDQNNAQSIIALKYDMDSGNFYLDTLKITYGTYRLSGFLSINHPGNYAIKQSTLYVTDESGRLPAVLSSGGLTKDYGTSTGLTVTLRDSYGNAISNTLVSINLNGKTSQIRTNAKGQAVLAVNMAPNTYTATVTFNGNDRHLQSTIKTTVTVKKATPKITAAKKTYKLKAKTKKYTITLKDNLGRAMKKVKVTLKVKGKKYTAKTNAKGKATFKLKLKKKGNFKATITFAGNAYYNKVTKTVKINIKK